MEQRLFYFNGLNGEQQIQEMFQIFDAGAYETGQFNKQFTQKFTSELYNYLSNPSNSGKTKFNALMVLRQIILKNDNKMISAILSSQQFLDFLQKNIMNTDPKKPINEKGRNLFPDDHEGYGNKYITLIIDIILYLASKFPRTSKNQPTRFKKILTNLQQENINLPQQLFYFKRHRKNKENQQMKQSTDTPDLKYKNKKQKEYEETDNRDRKLGKNFQSLVMFVRNKIDNYIGSLDDAEQPENMQETIIKTHEIFKGEINKFNEMGESIFQNSQDVVEKYLKIRGFLQQQTEIYDQHITSNHFAEYYRTIKIKYEQIFPQANEADENKMQKKNSQFQRSMNNNKENSQQDGDKRNMGNEDKKKSSSKVFSSAITGIFEKIQSREKSPYRGFKELKQSLEKEKKNIHLSPIRSNLTGKMASSNVSKSKIPTSSIFNNVPNSSPPYKEYQGELLLPNKQIQNILYDIKKEQSHKRFKVSNFKNKNPLFENQTMQIGFKSEHIFEEFDGFNTFLSMELYFGNKSDKQITNLQISFQSDENSLIYSNPMQIISYIDAQMQIKHSLMIIPIQIPFCFINMKVHYQCGASTIRTTVALPNSILQFSTLIETDNSSFTDYWSNTTTILKTEQFKLTKHIAPNSIRKYMSNLIELTSYSQFSLSQSITDYEVCCLVDVNDDYEGALKINFRPNLNVVIQMGMISPSFDGLKYLKFYVQTLQLLLQEINQ